MAKIVLNDISNITGNPTSAEQLLNDNFTKIEEAIENTLSRDGTAPNYLEASLDANSQRIVNLPYALSSTEPVTLAQVMALVTGEDWTGGVGIPAVVFYQDNEPTATAAGQVWVKPSDLSIWIWNGSDWIRQEDPNLQLAISIANDASAAVDALTPRVIAVEQDTANHSQAIIELESDVGNLAAEIVTLTSDYDDLSSAIQQEVIARTSADEALASAINSIQAFTNKIYVQATAPLDSPPGTLEEGDFWYDSDDSNHPYRWVSGAWVSVQDTSYTAPLYAAIDSEETARISGDTALANSIYSLQAQREDDYALIVNNNLASVSADNALASSLNSLTARMTTAEGDINLVEASIVNEASARVTGDSANATSISNLSTTVAGHTTSINTINSTINGIQGRYTVQIDSNGYVSGIDLIQNAAPGTAPYSTFTVSANAFRIAIPGTSIIPFQVVDGVTKIRQVMIDNTVVVDRTISTPKIASGAITDCFTVETNYNGGGFSTTTSGTWISLLNGLYVDGLVLFDPLDASGPSIARSRSYVNLRMYATARGWNAVNNFADIRILRNDGVILTPARIGLNSTYSVISWEWWDKSPVSTTHIYTLQISRSDWTGIGNFYNVVLNAVNYKK